MQQTILITGTSTGIGHAASELFAKKGWRVFAGSRDPDQLKFTHEHITPIALDVRDRASIDFCFASLKKQHIVPDCVVNNAGYGLLLPFEDTPEDEVRKLFDVNVFGLMEVSRRAAKIMREQGLPAGASAGAKAGTIINVSSVIGLVGIPWYGAYAASKWAVEGFSESFAHELRPFNVHVKIVEPGGTRTEFHKQAYGTGFPISEAYREKYERKKASHGKGGSYATPESIAQLIFEAANDDSWRLRYGAPEAKKALWGQRLLGRDGVWKMMSKRYR